MFKREGIVQEYFLLQACLIAMTKVNLTYEQFGPMNIKIVQWRKQYLQIQPWWIGSANSCKWGERKT